MSRDTRNLHAVNSDIQKEESHLQTTYIGTREDLIAASAATEDMFPVWPKRVRYHCSYTLPAAERYVTFYIKGGRYRVDRPHEYREPPEPPPTWNPAEFRARLQFLSGTMLDGILETAEGQVEQELYGQCVHRLSDKDIAALRQLREMLLARVTKSIVTPGSGGLRSV